MERFKKAFVNGLTSGPSIGSCLHFYLVVSTTGNMGQVSPLSLVSYPPLGLGMFERGAGVIHSNNLYSVPFSLGEEGDWLRSRVFINHRSIFNHFLTQDVPYPLQILYQREIGG